MNFIHNPPFYISFEIVATKYKNAAITLLPKCLEGLRSSLVWDVTQH